VAAVLAIWLCRIRGVQAVKVEKGCRVQPDVMP
jgi:hypothetical protein